MSKAVTVEMQQRVAEFLGLWRKGERCAERDSFIEDRARGQARCAKCAWNAPLTSPFVREHDIPCPDLLSPQGFDMILMALKHKGYHPQIRLCGDGHWHARCEESGPETEYGNSVMDCHPAQALVMAVDELARESAATSRPSR